MSNKFIILKIIEIQLYVYSLARVQEESLDCLVFLELMEMQEILEILARQERKAKKDQQATP